MPDYRLSVVVIAYNMARELPRTLRSLAPELQQSIDPADYEIIVVDNGSHEPLDEDRCRQWGGNLRFHRVTRATVSPAAAINAGLDLAQGELIGVMIDGARMASPGLLVGALRAAKLHPRPVISSLGFHLGPDVQMRSVREGYNQQDEDDLLAGINWPADGYKLFEISVFAGSSAQGWFLPISESNALFLPRGIWRELGGYDERFVSGGGGLVNLDTYVRACELPDNQLIILLGEGTFHQVHGGFATNARISPWKQFHEEYVRLRGKNFSAPKQEPWYFGEVRPPLLKSIELSARKARDPLAK
jgi:glycosyltransferase involved in cell wall biosynthesis